MSRKLLFVFLLFVLPLALAACGGGDEPAAATLPAATIASSEPTVEPAVAATSEPVADISPTAEAAPTDTPLPEATAAPAVLCPEVSRPALVLSTGTGYQLQNPLSGEQCNLPLPTEDIGPEFVAGEGLYFMQRNVDQSTVMVVRVGSDGIAEPLPVTQGAGETYYLMQFAVAPDESRLAWSQSERAGGDDPMALVSTLWLSAPDGSNATTVFEDLTMEDNRLATPVRFSADGQTLFFTWQPIGLGGIWSAFNGRYDNLYRLPADGGEPQVVFDCADQQLFLCIGDFRDDGTLVYVDADRVIHVNAPDGAELATIATTEDYAGYPTFTPAGDLVYSTAVIPADPTGVPLPAPGSVYRVAAPYSDEPRLVASAAGLLTVAMPQPFLDEEHLVVSYAEGETWGSALLNTTTGEITRLEPFPNSYLATVWDAN